MTRRFLFLFFLSYCLASCSSPPHWVTRDELRPSPDPNIQKVELADGPVFEFNHALGWYDAEKNIIEGVTILGSHDTIPLARVQRVELAGKSNSGQTTLAVLLVFFLGCFVVFLVAIASAFP
jgi:hypothetical protein